MGKTHQKYDFETKVAAVKAVVDEGSSKTMVMERFGIVSVTALENWCRLYRSGGVEALRSKPRGSPEKSNDVSQLLTYEQELELEVRRLKAQVAYLKNR